MAHMAKRGSWESRTAASTVVGTGASSTLQWHTLSTKCFPTCLLPASRYPEQCLHTVTHESDASQVSLLLHGRRAVPNDPLGGRSATAMHETMSGPRAAAGVRSPPVPDGVILDWHHAWGQQLELLLNLEPVAPAGHLDAPVEHGRIRLALQRPAWSPLCHQHGILQQASQLDRHHDHTRLCRCTPLPLARIGVDSDQGAS